MKRFTVGALKETISALDDGAEINLTLDIKRIDGRNIRRCAEVTSVEASQQAGALFGWLDIVAKADLAPANFGWALMEDGKITEEEYLRLVAK